MELDHTKRENAALKQQVQALAERLTALEGKVAAPPPTETFGGQAPPAGDQASAAPAGDPAKDFTQARQLMLAGDYDGAEQAFADYRRTGFGGWPWPVDDPVHGHEGRFARHADGRTERPGLTRVLG